MLRSLSTAAAGMDAQQTKLDVTANNIANVSTAGFKKARAEFSELMVQVSREPGAAVGRGHVAPTGLEVGLGVQVAGTQRMFGQGDLKQTGNPLDLAIEGPGFFRVELENGGEAYTRNGALRLDPEGRIVTADGHPLAGELSIPPDAEAITVSPNGLVSAKVPGDSAAVEVGRIELATFANPAGLVARGHTLLEATEASGAPIVVAPGESNVGALSQGTLELSNVKVVEEMIELIAGQRAYEVNSRVIKAADEMLQQAATLR